MIGKRLSTIVFLIAVAVLASAQTTKSMNKDNKEKIPLYSYSEKELEKVSSYIERQYGEYEDVIHEIVSPDIHCDIVLVPPTDSSPYYKLVTMGAGAYKMSIPKEFKSMICDRAEYVIFLPKDWNVDSDNEEDWWPMRLLKSAARLTVDTDDYLYSERKWLSTNCSHYTRKSWSSSWNMVMTIWSNCSRRSLWSSISIARTIARNKRG